MRNTGLDKAQAGIKTAGRNANHLRYADDTTVMAENKDELKSLLMYRRRSFETTVKVRQITGSRRLMSKP